MKSWAIVAAVYGCLTGRKWANLVSLSTTTKMTLKPWDLGNPSIKSMDKSLHTPSGIGRGWSKPNG